MSRGSWSRRSWCWVALLWCGCAAASGEEAAADRPTLPYRVLLCGGSFLERDTVGPLTEPDRRLLAPTTFPTDAAEGIPREQILASLRDGGVFVDSLLAATDDDPARRRALLSDGVLRPSLESTPGFQALGAEAERRGADVLLVLEGLRDGPITTTGTNGQWPITVVAWLTVGLGMFIRDHTFDSGAVLRASLREPVHGRLLASFTISAPSLDLPLVSRSDFLGLMSSLLVPPPWVGTDAERAAAQVRTHATEALAEGLVRKLKSRETLANLLDTSPVRIRVTPAGERALLLEVQSDQDLAEVRLLRNGEPLLGDGWLEFRARLLASGRTASEAGAPLRFSAQSPPLPEPQAAELRILVRTVRGDVVSQTVRLPL